MQCSGVPARLSLLLSPPSTLLLPCLWILAFCVSFRLPVNVPVFPPGGAAPGPACLPCLRARSAWPMGRTSQPIRVRDFGKTGAFSVLGEGVGAQEPLRQQLVFQNRNSQWDFAVSLNSVHLEKVNILYHSLD